MKVLVGVFQPSPRRKPWIAKKLQASALGDHRILHLFRTSIIIEIMRVLSIIFCYLFIQKRQGWKSIYAKHLILLQILEYDWSHKDLRKRAWEMLHSCKVLRTFELLCVFWENPSREKWRKNCTGFSAEFFGFQSVEIFCFAKKTKIKMLTTSSRSLTRIHQCFLRSLVLYFWPVG